MSEDTQRILLVNRCLIKDKEDKILFIQREQNSVWKPGKWEFPGGKVDEGQDVSYAVEREVMEETALFIRVNSPICYFESHVSETGKYKGTPLVLLVGIGELIGGKVKLSHEHQDYKWLTKDEALELDLTPDTRKALISLTKTH